MKDDLEKKAKKLRDYRIRICYSMHECALCSKTISFGQLYHDGGYGRRAHIVGECKRHDEVDVDAKLNELY